MELTEVDCGLKGNIPDHQNEIFKEITLYNQLQIKCLGWGECGGA